jgi:hypothetical protein
MIAVYVGVYFYRRGPLSGVEGLNGSIGLQWVADVAVQIAVAILACPRLQLNKEGFIPNHCLAAVLAPHPRQPVRPQEAVLHHILFFVLQWLCNFVSVALVEHIWIETVTPLGAQRRTDIDGQLKNCTGSKLQRRVLKKEVCSPFCNVNQSYGGLRAGNPPGDSLESIPSQPTQ